MGWCSDVGMGYIVWKASISFTVVAGAHHHGGASRQRATGLGKNIP